MNEEDVEKKEVDPKIQEERVQGLKRSLEKWEKQDEIIGKIIMYPIIGLIILIILFAIFYPKILGMFVVTSLFKMFAN